MTAHEGGDVPRGMAVIDVILGGLPCRLVLPEVVAAPLRERYRGYEHAVAPVLR